MKKKIFVFILLCFVFTGCGSKAAKDELLRANEKMVSMKSYSCNAEITVYGNKQNSTYKVKQFYIYPDKYRIETIEPAFLKDIVSIYRDGKWFINHPLINQKFISSKNVDMNDLINCGVITKNMFNSDNFKSSYSELEGKEYIKIAGMIPDSTKYKNSVVLYICLKEYYPVYMDIYDDKNSKVMEVKYDNFTFNPAIDASKFTIN